MDIGKTFKSFFNSTQSNKKALMQYLGIEDGDIIKMNWDSSIHYPAYIVALDHVKKAIVISVRGTMTTYDMLTDMNAKNHMIEIYDQITKKTFKGYVHKGFYKSAKNIIADIEDGIDKLRETGQYDDYVFRVVGHSLGGATAYVISFLLLSEKYVPYDKLKCYSYGPPPTFCNKLANLYKNQIISVVNGQDIVCKICATSVQLYLAGKIIHYQRNNDGSMVTEKDKEYFMGLGITEFSFADHLPNRYEQITQFIT
jgi:sn1-specific diacylglycerol lipase